MALPARRSPTGDFSDRKFGAVTRPLTSDVTVTDAPTRLCLNNPARIELTVINTGIYQIGIYFRPATTSDYIPIDPNGGMVTLVVDEDGEVMTWEWFARILNVTGVTNAVSIFEVIIL